MASAWGSACWSATELPCWLPREYWWRSQRQPAAWGDSSGLLSPELHPIASAASAMAPASRGSERKRVTCIGLPLLRRRAILRMPGYFLRIRYTVPAGNGRLSRRWFPGAPAGKVDAARRAAKCDDGQRARTPRRARNYHHPRLRRPGFRYQRIRVVILAIVAGSPGWRDIVGWQGCGCRLRRELRFLRGRLCGFRRANSGGRRETWAAAEAGRSRRSGLPAGPVASRSPPAQRRDCRSGTSPLSPGRPQPAVWGLVDDGEDVKSRATDGGRFRGLALLSAVLATRRSHAPPCRPGRPCRRCWRCRRTPRESPAVEPRQCPRAEAAMPAQVMDAQNAMSLESRHFNHRKGEWGRTSSGSGGLHPRQVFTVLSLVPHIPHNLC